MTPDLVRDVACALGAWFLIAVATYQLLAVVRGWRSPHRMPLDGMVVVATTGAVTAVAGGFVFLTIIVRRFG